MSFSHERVAFETDLGWVAMTQQEGVLTGLVFAHSSQRAALRRLDSVVRGLPAKHGTAGTDRSSGHSPAGDELFSDVQQRLVRFAAGEAADFRDVPLDESHLTPFARRVVAACRRIGWGETRTYGQLAATCGSPGAARAVGRVMAENRFPLVVPCHRVVAAGGGLGGYSAPQGLRMKRRLLEMEAAALCLVG